MMSNDYVLQEGKCPVCGSIDTDVLLDISQVPVHCSLLWPNREESMRAPRGDVRLGFCRDCGHIFNLAFNPDLMEYTQAYENSLHFSPCFQSYAESLARRLIERYDLHDKDIVEIGCGKGDFLSLLCELGGNRGIGFDPSYVPDSNDQATAERITFIQDFYSERYANYRADIICCRHVLEHIRFPRDFLGSVRRSIGDQADTVVFFEVPNGLFTLKDLGIWDLIYEHRSYFSPNALSRLFTLCGFDVHALTEVYAGQFLCIEALPGERDDVNRRSANSASAPRDDLAGVEMAADAAAFADQYRSKVETWKRHFERMEQADQRVVVWGAGSKGVTFLNTLRIQDQVEYVVDINPRKQGMYVAGTGQQIVPPEFLRNYQPEVVIVMNPIYKSEIQQFAERLGLTAEFTCA